MTTTAPRSVTPISPLRQTAIGLTLAAAIVGGWLMIHVWGVFFVDIAAIGWLAALALMVVQCWLSVGLFIIAHDCMHGSLVPGRPRVNTAIGTLVLALYAGFEYLALRPKHYLHHRHPGSGDDPDFLARPPHGFWQWYAKFFGEYFSWLQLVLIAAVFWGYVLVLGAQVENVVLFWALPAILSSLQLFTFGTFLPHVPGADGFHDRHNARSNDYPPLLSLLSCFHFGYHHEHHESPGVPWWRLPAYRRQARGDRR